MTNAIIYRTLWTVFSLVVLLLITVPSSIAKDVSVIDQQQTNERGWYTGIDSNKEVAQVFTPSVSGYMDGVSILLGKYPGIDYATGALIPPGDMIIEARPTTEGIACLSGCNSGTTTTILPSEQIITSSVLTEPEITEDAWQWYEIRFDNPAFLCANVPYALVLFTNDPWIPNPDTMPGGYVWPMDSDNILDPYPRGYLMERSDGTKNMWSVNGYWIEDATFITYMAIVDTPSLQALAAGLGIAECSQTDPCCGDLDGDGDVDGRDLSILVSTLTGGED